MAKTVQTEREYTGLYDPETGKSCDVVKAVDITDDCPGLGKRVLLVFVRARQDLIVQICHPGEGAYFLMDNLDSPNRMFDLMAEELGLTSRKLRALIKACAPSTSS